MRNPNFPQDLASFWDQIPLQMAKILKKPLSGHNIRQLIKKLHNRLKKTHFLLNIQSSPLGLARALKIGHMQTIHMAKR
jgi:hypothetical protein